MPKTLALLWRHVPVLAAVAAVAVFGCPAYELLGVSCPLCGTTRAWLSFLSGEIGTALRYHPLFFATPFWFFAAVHYDCLFRKNRVLGWVLVLMAGALAIIHVLRLLGIVDSLL